MHTAIISSSKRSAQDHDHLVTIESGDAENKASHPSLHSQQRASPASSTLTQSVKSLLTSFRANPVNSLITLLTEALHVLFVVSFYDFVKIIVSSSTMNVNGVLHNSGQWLGYQHALRVIQIEQSLGAFFEARLQQLFLPFGLFLKFWNLYYVMGHFVVTVLCILFLAIRFPRNYQRFRNIFFWMNIIGVFFYAIYPLMPPRLVSRDCLPSGTACPEYGFVDTLADPRYTIALNPTKSKSANSYAAMPSMHIGWALCVGLLGLLPLAKTTWTRVASLLYPICMVYCIIITANHFWLDAVGGVVTYMVTYAAVQYYPSDLEYGHGAHQGHENDHYASWISVLLAAGVFIMNPVIPVKVLAFIMGSFFVFHCLKNRIIPFMYSKNGRSLPL